MPLRMDRLNAPDAQVQRETLAYLKGVGRSVPRTHVSQYLGFTQQQVDDALKTLMAERLVDRSSSGWVQITRHGIARVRAEAA